MRTLAVWLVAAVLPLLGACGGEVAAVETERAERPLANEDDLDLGLPRERIASEDVFVEPRIPSLSAHSAAQAASAPPVARAEAPREPQPGSNSRSKPDPRLAARVQALIDAAGRTAHSASKGRVHGGNATVAVHLAEVGGAELYARDASAPLIPASNLKVLTVAAALALHGAEGAFTTTFEAHGKVVDGRLAGDLVARAGGDPLYAVPIEGSAPEGASTGAGTEAWLERLAEALTASGIRAIDGRLVLDDSGWEQPGIPPEWPSANDHWQAYCARSGGFTANGGCITASVTPTRSGRPAEVRLTPRDVGLDTRVGVTTGPRRSGNDVRVGATASTATVRGALAEGELTFHADFAHPSPVDLFGSAVVGGLARRDRPVARGYERARCETRAPVVATLSTPYTSFLEPILRDSNNPVTDQLFFASAHRLLGSGTRADGANAVREGLRRLGVDPTGYTAVDGSGLSKADRCTAAQLTGALAALASGPAAAFLPFHAALPVAAMPGKLQGRMRGTRAAGCVRAKTGFVNGASALCGYIDCADGRRYCFAILVNYPQVSGLNNAAWKPLQDDLCALFAEEVGA